MDFFFTLNQNQPDRFGFTPVQNLTKNETKTTVFLYCTSLLGRVLLLEFYMNLIGSEIIHVCRGELKIILW